MKQTITNVFEVGDVLRWNNSSEEYLVTQILDNEVYLVQKGNSEGFWARAVYPYEVLSNLVTSKIFNYEYNCLNSPF